MKRYESSKNSSTLSVALGAIFLSLIWLSPNHGLPWTSFHSDAWAAIMLAVFAVPAIFRKAQNSSLHGFPLLIALLVPLPIIQYFFDLIGFSGQAWISSLYLLGLLIAILAGQYWQEIHPLALGDVLFTSIGIASIVSVGLQLQQWFGIGRDGSLDIWIISGTAGGRPSANLGQANQLATLLLWGLLSCAWGVWRGEIRNSVAAALAAFLFAGIALTQSRTAAIGVLVLVAAAWGWRRLLEKKNFSIFFSALALAYFSLMLSLPYFAKFLLIDHPSSMSERVESELRPQLWKTLLDAAFDRPLLGYGWNQTFSAQLEVADTHPRLGAPFFQAHNLFVDLILWVGFPLGLTLSICLICWAWSTLRKVNNCFQATYFLLIAVVAIHAMLEYPLSYAYFLLPTGVAIGALGLNSSVWKLKNIKMWQARLCFGIAIFCGGALSAVVMRDYLKIQETYNSIQLEIAGIREAGSTRLPVVALLDQLKEAQALLIFNSYMQSPATKVDWAKNVVRIAPSSKNFMAVAILLGLDRRPQEAQQWLVKMCSIVPRDQCNSAPLRWRRAQVEFPRLENIGWPSEGSAEK